MLRNLSTDTTKETTIWNNAGGKYDSRRLCLHYFMNSKKTFKGNFVCTSLPSTLTLEPNHTQKNVCCTFFEHRSLLETSHGINVPQNSLEN